MHLASLLLLTACGSPETGKGPVAGATDDTAAAGDSGPVESGGDCETPGFAAASVDWPLPVDAPAGVFDHFVDVRPDDGVSWSLLDLDGDDLRDLVVTERPDGGAGLGARTWQVHRNTGGGFDAAVDWALPAGFPDGAFARTSDTVDGDGLTWTLFELTGDGALDLVVSRTPADPMVGTTRWQVFENTGTGFAEAPLDWGLPAGFPDGTFQRLADVVDDDLTWTVLDLDGDGGADIVQTGAPDGSIGTTTWRWFANTGDGFAGTSASWSLPAGFADGAFATWADRDPEDGLSWARIDLDGDTIGDLVVTERPDDPAVGAERWDVYPSRADGFAPEPVAWSLPPGAPTGALALPFDADGAADGEQWVLTDLDGAGGPDLVWTAGAVVEAGGWARYDNEGAGFAADATEWRLPTDLDPGQLSSWMDPSPDDALGWFLASLDDDERVDLVVTRDPAASEVGASVWAVHRGVCE